MACLKAIDFVAKSHGRQIALSFSELESSHRALYSSVQECFRRHGIELDGLRDGVVDECLGVYQVYLQYMHLVFFSNDCLRSSCFKTYWVVIDRKLGQIESRLEPVFWLDFSEKTFYNAINSLTYFHAKILNKSSELILSREFLPVYVFTKRLLQRQEIGTFNLQILTRILDNFRNTIRSSAEDYQVLADILANIKAAQHSRIDLFEEYIAAFVSTNHKSFADLEATQGAVKSSKLSILRSSNWVGYQREFDR